MRVGGRANACRVAVAKRQGVPLLALEPPRPPDSTMPLATAEDGARLAYEVLEPTDGAAGPGEPLLLLSGQGLDRGMWDRAAPDFAAAGYRVVRWDYRGTGESDAPDAPYSTRGFAADAVAVLDAAGVARAHAYGISMGGRVAQWLALDSPARVGALVLGATTPGNAGGVGRDAEAERLLRVGDPVGLADLIASPAFFAAHPDATAFVQRSLRPHARRLHFQASAEHDAWELLGGITASTLVLHGGDDRLNPTANAPLMAARIPGAELAMIPGARHGYVEEFREEAARIVIEFLRRHPL